MVSGIRRLLNPFLTDFGHTVDRIINQQRVRVEQQLLAAQRAAEARVPRPPGADPFQSVSPAPPPPPDHIASNLQGHRRVGAISNQRVTKVRVSGRLAYLYSWLYLIRPYSRHDLQ